MAGENIILTKLSGLKRESKGQALIEFSLILVVLLTMIFTIVESGRLFQGWLAVQNATRAAGRYAITGQFEKDCLNEFPPCLDPRVDAIEAEARRTVAGVPVDPTVVVGQPSSLAVEVWGQDEDGIWYPDYAGEAGQNVRIRVTYYMPIVTPLLQPIVEMVPLVGQIVAINEDFDQFSTSQVNYDPPTTGDVGGPLVVPEANLVITKTVASPDVVTGDPPSIFTTKNVKFDIEVRNKGPFDAEGVMLTDLLPDDFIYVSYTATRNAQCDEPQNPAVVTSQINCLLPDLAGDEGTANEKVVYLSITAQTPIVPVFETITNTVSVSMDPTAVDPVPGDNSSSAGLELIPHVDLIVSKDDSVDPAIVGEPFTYQINVSNPGPNTAEDVEITDRMPQNFTYQSYAISTGTCTEPDPTDPNDRDLNCSIGDLAASDTAILMVIGIPEVEGSIENNAWANSLTTHEDNPTNNSASETTQVKVVANLEISKSGPSQVDFGDDINYVLNVTNNGPSPADNITVIDELPVIGGNPAVSYRSSSSGCTPAPSDEVHCTISTLAANASTQLTITVQAIQLGDAYNRASVSSASFDPDTNNNSFTVSTFIRAKADLGVEKNVAGPAILGEALDFTIDVTNFGPSPAPGIVIRDSLDPSIVLDEDTMSVSGCDKWQLSGSDIECNINYLDVGATTTVKLTVLVKSNINIGGVSELENDVTVSLNGTDPDTSNNSDSVSTNLVFPSRLSILKTGPDETEVGSTYSYQLKVVNQGPVKATNVVVEDLLPTLTSFISASPTNNCKGQNGRVTCNFSELAAGDPQIVVILVKANEVGIANNTATIKADQIDPDISDNSSTWQTDILPSADLKLELDPGSTKLIVPRNTHFDIGFLVTNLGPSSAKNVVLTITTNIPADIVHEYPLCTEITNNGNATFICNRGTLAVGGPQILDVTFLISEWGNYTFNASITTTTFDPNTLNNLASPGTVDVN